MTTGDAACASTRSQAKPHGAAGERRRNLIGKNDLLPLARKLPRGEQLRLARGLLEPEPGTADDLLAKRRAGIGRYAGQGWIAEDFDAPLPPEVHKYFDGEDDAGDVLGAPDP